MRLTRSLDDERGSGGYFGAWVVLSIAVLGYLFEFFLALFVFHKEGYRLRWRALKERLHWRWSRGWKTWGIICVAFLLGFGLTILLQPLGAGTANLLPPPDWFPSSQHPLKEAESLEENLPGVVFTGNYLFLLLVLFTGTMNIVGEERQTPETFFNHHSFPKSSMN